MESFRILHDDNDGDNDHDNDGDNERVFHQTPEHHTCTCKLKFSFTVESVFSCAK